MCKVRVGGLGRRVLAVIASVLMLAMTSAVPAAAQSTATAALTPEVSAADGGQAGLGASIAVVQGGASTTISSFSMTLAPSGPQAAQVLNVICPAAYSCTFQTDATTGAMTVSGSGSGGAVPGELAFFSLVVTAPVGQLVPMTLTIQSLSDSNGAAIAPPAPVTYNLERGAVVNLADGSPTSAQPVTQADVEGALGFLSGRLAAGSAAGQVNPVNLASLLPASTSLPNAPGPANVVALLQFLNGQRDTNLVQSPALPITVTAFAASGNEFSLAFSSPVPRLISSDLTLVDSTGNPVQIQGLHTTDGGLTYTVAAYLTPGAGYTIGVALPGYAFGNPVGFTTPSAPPITETPTVTSASPSGFILQVSPQVTAPLTASALTLRMPSGSSVPIASISSPDAGTTFIVAAALVAGQSYTLTLALQGYDFGSPLAVQVPSTPATDTVTATATGGGLQLGFDPLVPGLTAGDVTLRDSQGNLVATTSVSPTVADAGKTYTVEGNLAPGDSYTVAVSMPGYDFGAAVPFVVPMGNLVYVGAQSPSVSGFTMTLTQPVPGLTASEVRLSGSQGAVPITSLTTSDGGSTYHASADLSAGQFYLEQVSAPSLGLDFVTPAGGFYVPQPVTAQVTGVNYGGLSVQLGQAVDLTAGDFHLKDAAGHDVTVTSASSIDYRNYALSAATAFGGSYTLTISPPSNLPLAFTPASLSFSVPKLAVTAQDVTANGFSLDLSVPVSDLSASDFALTDGQGGTVPVQWAASPDNGAHYSVSAMLQVGETYTIAAVVGGQTLGALGTVALPAIPVGWQVANVRSTGFDLTLSWPSPALSPAAVQLTDASGQTVPVTVTSAQPTFHVTPRTPLTPGGSYTLALSVPGYSFATAQTLSVPLTSVTASVGNATTDGFTLLFNPAAPGLTSSDLALSGGGADLTLGSSTDGGASYPVSVGGQGLSPGADYQLTLSAAGADFGAPIDVPVPPTTVAGTVYAVGESGLTLALSPAVPGLDAGSVALTDTTTGQPVAVGSCTTADNGASYALALPSGAQFSPGQSYTLSLTTAMDALTSDLTFAGPEPETVYVTNVSPGGFMVSTSPAIGLTATELRLTANGQSVPILGYTNGNVFEELAAGQSYSLTVQDAGYTFTEPGAFSLPVTVSAFDPSTSGFTLAFDVPVSGLAPSDVIVTDASKNAVGVTGVAPLYGGYQYAVSAALAPGQTYTVAPVLAGVTFQSSASAAVPAQTEAVETSGVTANGFVLDLTPADPNLEQSDIQVSGASSGASVSATLGSSSDGGSTYPVTLGSALQPSQGVKVTLAQGGYAFNPGYAYLPATSVTASVYGASTSGFTLSLNPAVSGLTPQDVYVVGQDGSMLGVSSLTTSDNGATYSASADLPPEGYTLYLQDPSVAFTSQPSFTVSPVSVSASVYGPTPVGFTLDLSQALPGGRLLILNLTDSAGSLAIALGTQAGATSYTVLSPLAPGDTYTLGLQLAAYQFSGPAAFSATDTSATGVATYLATSMPDWEVASILAGDGYGLSDIAKALVAAFPGTTDAGLVPLLQSLGESADPIVGALKAAFPSETAAQATAVLRAAGGDAVGITSGLEATYGETDAAMAALLEQNGFNASDVAIALLDVVGETEPAAVAALQAAGFSPTDTARALGSAYGSDSGDAAARLAAAGDSASEVTAALVADFDLADPPVLAQTLEQAGFSASDSAQQLLAQGVTDPGLASVMLGNAGYSASDVAQAAVQVYSASAAEVAAAALPFEPSADAMLSLLATAGFTDEATLAGALVAAGFSAQETASALLNQFPGSEAVLGPDLTAAGVPFPTALQAMMGLGGGGDTAAVAAAWPALFASSGTIAPAATAAQNLKASGCGGLCSAQDAAQLLETVYNPTSGGALGQALVGGGYSFAETAGVLRGWYAAAGVGTGSDDLTGLALADAGATPVEVAETLQATFGDGASQLLPVLAGIGVTSAADVIGTLEQAGFSPANVTAVALSLAGGDPGGAVGILASAGYSATAATVAVERAEGGSLSISQVTAMLANVAESGASLSPTDVAQALESYFGATPSAAGQAMLGPNLPYGVGDVAGALKAVYALPGGDFVPIVQAAGLSPLEVLTNGSCRLSLLCALQTTFGLSATGTLQALHGAGRLSDGSLPAIMTDVLQAYSITGNGPQAAALSQGGYSLPEIAAYLTASGLSLTQALSTLRQQGYSATAAAADLKSAYGSPDYGTAATLQAAGYSLDDIVIALEANYDDAGTLLTTLVSSGVAKVSDASAAIANAGGVNAPVYVAGGMAGYGYDAATIVTTLMQAFQETDPNVIAQNLQAAGIGAQAAVQGLRVALQTSASQAKAVLVAEYGVSSATQQATDLSAAGYAVPDIIAALGSTDPRALASTLLGGGIQPFEVQQGLAQAFGPNGSIDDPVALAEALNQLGAASFHEADASALLTADGYTAAQQAVLMLESGYSMQDIGAAAYDATAAASGTSDIYDALMAALYQAYTCSGSASGFGVCAPGTFSATDALTAFEDVTQAGPGTVAEAMATAGFSLGQITQALYDPAGIFHLPVVAPVVQPGSIDPYGENLVDALAAAGFTPSQVVSALQAPPISASLDGIAAAFYTAVGSYGLDATADGIDSVAPSRMDALQSMEHAGYSAIEAGTVLQYWGYSEAEVAWDLYELGYGWEEAGNLLQLYPDTFSQISGEIAQHEPQPKKP